jgi:tetratricopeptide (TPR) repeat protein
VIGVLRAEEANLLQARDLARRHGWWGRVISAMQGLRTLYGHTGRRAEWARLVAEVVPEFVDPATEGPLPGREEQWSFVTEYRVRLAREGRHWAEAERLQGAQVAWTRQRAAGALGALAEDRPGGALDGAERNSVRTLAVSLEQLGQIQREQGKPSCVESFEEAIPLCQRIDDKPEESVLSFKIGHAYKNLADLRELDQAERWYRRSLELHDEGDRLGRGKCLNQLGSVAYERFGAAREAREPEEGLLRHLNEAVRYYHQGLDLLPPDAVDALAVTHHQLGSIYDNAGDLDRALPHYRDSIRYEEVQGNLYGAAQTRFNVALALADAGRLPDALAYARAALGNYQTYGQGAAADVQRTQGLIAEIERLMKAGGG